MVTAKHAPAKKHSPAKKPTATVIGNPNSDQAWKARQDMHTLKDAEAIKADPKRHTAAVHHAKAEVGALQKVARKRV